MRIEYLAAIVIAILIVVVYVFTRMFLAKMVAINNRVNNLPLFYGMVRLISWEPNEGIVVLRHKQLSKGLILPEGDLDATKGEFIQIHEGGMKFIYPINGQELHERITLKDQMTPWEDKEVQTRESIRVQIKVAVWWRVSNLPNYVFRISREVSGGGGRRGSTLMEAGEEWLKTKTEGTLRTLVSQSSIASLVTANPVGYMRVASGMTSPGDPNHGHMPEVGIPETLGKHLEHDLREKVMEYGIRILKVEIQNIGVTPEILQALENMYKVMLEPIKAEHEARAREIKLRSLAGVIGIDNVAMNELLKNFKGSSFLGMPSVVENALKVASAGAGQARPNNPAKLPGQSPQPKPQLPPAPPRPRQVPPPP